MGGGKDEKKDKRSKSRKKTRIEWRRKRETREAAAKRGLAFLLIKPRRRGLRS